MRLAGAVVADNQHPFGIRRPVEAQLRQDDRRQPFSHGIGDDVGAHQLLSLILAVGLAQLDDGLDGIELDEVSIEHGGLFLPAQSGGIDNGNICQIGRVIAPVFGMAWLGVDQVTALCQDTGPDHQERTAPAGRLQHPERINLERRVKEQLDVVYKEVAAAGQKINSDLRSLQSTLACRHIEQSLTEDKTKVEALATYLALTLFSKAPWSCSASARLATISSRM